MKVFYSLDDDLEFINPVVTVGSFDGVHAGHRVLLDKVKELALQVNGESVVVTFSPHPREVLHPDSEIKLLNTLEEKVYLLNDAGIDNLIVLPFTKEFAAIPYDEFVRGVLVNKIGVKHLVVGYDHKFGHNKEGDFAVLHDQESELGFNVEQVECHTESGYEVSSTEVRNAIVSGNMKCAAELLSRGYIIIANLDTDGSVVITNPLKLVPMQGVYTVEVLLEGKHKSCELQIAQNNNIMLTGVDPGNNIKKIIILFE